MVLLYCGYNITGYFKLLPAYVAREFCRLPTGSPLQSLSLPLGVRQIYMMPGMAIGADQVVAARP